MTRRYGWRALLKALKVEGTHKGSEVEIKVLPIKTLGREKQARATPASGCQGDRPSFAPVA